MKAVTFSFPLRKPIGGMCDVAAIGVVNSICGVREVLLVRRFMIGVRAVYTTMRPAVMDAWSVPSAPNPRYYVLGRSEYASESGPGGPPCSLWRTKKRYYSTPAWARKREV